MSTFHVIYVLNFQNTEFEGEINVFFIPVTISNINVQYTSSHR